jgi:hypothetical protein
MTINWHIFSHISTELQQASDFQEVVGIWHQYLPYLHDCKLIYSQREEADIVLPSKDWPRDFRKGGYLRPLFAHDNLCLLDRRIAEEQWLHVESRLNIDSTVEFDTNVASYVEMFVEGKENANTERVRELLDFVITNERVNFGYDFYALENAQGYYDGSNVPSIRRNLRALMKLDCLDEEWYLKTGEVRAVLTERELDVRADEKLQELYAEPYPTVLAAEHQHVNEMLYLVLLKTVEIEHRAERRSLAQKVAELYEFMHYELKTLLVREAIIALHYFKHRARLTFFGKIKPKPTIKGPELLKELKNMSWDLMLFRLMERIATVGGVGDFLIPYFLSFDRKMVQLFDLYPLKGLLFNDQNALMIPLWKTTPIEALAKEIDIRVVEDYFGHTCSSIRQAERRLEPRPDFSQLKQDLEAAVVRLLTY